MRLSAAILSFHSALASILGGSGLEWTRRPGASLNVTLLKGFNVQPIISLFDFDDSNDFRL